MVALTYMAIAPTIQILHTEYLVAENPGHWESPIRNITSTKIQVFFIGDFRGNKYRGVSWISKWNSKFQFEVIQMIIGQPEWRPISDLVWFHFQMIIKEPLAALDFSRAEISSSVTILLPWCYI